MITQILQFLCELCHQHQQPWRVCWAVTAWQENSTCCIWAASPSRGGSLATCNMLFIWAHYLHCIFMQSSCPAKACAKEWDEAQGKAKTWSAVRAVLAPALALTYKHAIKGTKITFFLPSISSVFPLQNWAKHWQSISKEERSHSQLLYIYSVYRNKWSIQFTETNVHHAESICNIEIERTAKLTCSKLDDWLELETCLTRGPPAPPSRLARPEALPPPSEPPNSW